MIDQNHIVSSETIWTDNKGYFIPELWSEEILAAYKQALVTSHLYGTCALKHGAVVEITHE